MHVAVGEKAAACADVVLAAGRESTHLVAAARAAGMAQDAARHFEQPEQLGEFAAAQLRRGDVVLVKALPGPWPLTESSSAFGSS